MVRKLFCLVAIMNTVINAQAAGEQRYFGMKKTGIKGGTYTTAEIMAWAKNKEAFYDESLTKSCSKKKKHDAIRLNFLGARLEQADYMFPSNGSFPPDTMGAVGPTQFVVALNGRIRSFDKTTGQPDFILDTTANNFFMNVSNNSHTTDPRIRYDRFTERWFIIMITGQDMESGDDEVPNIRAGADISNNRIMFAVSSTKDITIFTEWRFSFIEAGEEFFFDYPTLGIDNQALYIGGLLLTTGSILVNPQRLYVVNKEELVVVNDLVFTEFDYPVNSIFLPEAPFVPQGVDNFDEDASVGNFIAFDSFSSNHLVLNRVFNPGSDTPTLSDPILIEIPGVCSPFLVPQRGTDRYLDPNSDVRLMMAHIRNGHLWTAHHIGVNNQGTCASEEEITRDGCRWYEIDVKNDQPRLMQYGTLFDKTKKNIAGARFFWTPSLMTTGQGAMALGCSTAGKDRFVDCAIARRFKNDPQGTLQKPIIYTDSGTVYNPALDPSNPLRWGDYSYTSVDPCDDMTIWTIQEYCVDTDQWGVQVAQLRAPAPAKLASVLPNKIDRGKSSVNVIIHGKSEDGSGFFNPGKDFDCRLQVTISGGVTVEKVKYIDPTKIKVTVSTEHATRGAKKIKVINPDGQKVVAHDLLSVV